MKQFEKKLKFEKNFKNSKNFDKLLSFIDKHSSVGNSKFMKGNEAFNLATYKNPCGKHESVYLNHLSWRSLMNYLN